MAQKRRKNAVLVSVLLPVELIREIDGRVEHLGIVSRNPPRSRSEWIKRAIRRDLEHDARSRSKYGRRGVQAVSGTTQVVGEAVGGVRLGSTETCPFPQGFDPTDREEMELLSGVPA